MNTYIISNVNKRQEYSKLGRLVCSDKPKFMKYIFFLIADFEKILLSAHFFHKNKCVSQ